MKTPEEIKRGLECCVTQYNCHIGDEQCCYHGGGECHYFVMCDALSYIQQLEGELEQVKRERDAATKELEDMKARIVRFRADLAFDINFPMDFKEHIIKTDIAAQLAECMRRKGAIQYDVRADGMSDAIMRGVLTVLKPKEETE